MSSISNINAAGVRSVIANMTLNVPALAINAAGAATVKTTNAIEYSVGGIGKSKAALSAQSIAVTHDFQGTAVAKGFKAYAQPAGTRAIYVLSVNAAGTVAVSQGTYVGQRLPKPGDLSVTMDGTGFVPAEPKGYTAFGAIVISLANAATFTPGTTALDAANVSATFYDISVLPEEL